MLTVLGIDPGARRTGIVLRRGEDLLGWRLHTRIGPGRMPRGPDLAEIQLACTQLLRAAAINPRTHEDYVVGVEQVEYWPDRGRIRRNQSDLYGTAMVYASILTRWADATVVDAGRGVGNYHPQAYPAAIRQANGKGRDSRRDVRAAWDHSLAAETVYLTHLRGIVQ